MHDEPLRWPPRGVKLTGWQKFVASPYNPLSWPFRLMAKIDEVERDFPTIGGTRRPARLYLMEARPSR